MKLILLTFLCLAGVARTRANVIDQLQTDQQVRDFLVNRVSEDFKRYTLFPERSPTSPEKASKPNRDTLYGRWFKADINADGLTDLIVTGEYLWVIMDQGNGKFSLQTLCDYLIGCRLTAIDSTGKPPRLVVREKAFRNPRTDSLVYWSGNMIEYNRQPLAPFRFESISVSTSRCFGGKCPVFTMTVTVNGRVEYNAQDNNKEAGIFVGKIPGEELQNMLAILHYLPLGKMEPSYNDDWQDAATIEVEVRYNGGREKWEDHGEQGTLGLRLLYPYFYYWKDNVRWKPKN